MSDADDFMARIDARIAARPLGAEQRCGNCVFWEDHEHRKEVHADDREGECHRNAPSPVADLFAKIGAMVGRAAWALEDSGDIQHEPDPDYLFERADLFELGNWPIVNGGEWCGEFKRRPA